MKNDVLSIVSPMFSLDDTFKVFDQIIPWIDRYPTRTRQNDISSKYFDFFMDESLRSKIENENLILSCDLPGVEKSDISMSIKDNTLKIKAFRKDINKNYDFAYLISKDYDVDSCSAEFKNGVLTVTLNRSKDTVTKQIEIR